MAPRPWLTRRRAQWQRLEELVGLAARRGLATMAVGDLRELTLLYRQAAADLSAVRGDRSLATDAARLNHLMGRAHNLIYSAGAVRGRGIVHFYRVEFPRVVCEAWALIAAASALLIVGAAVGAALTLADARFPHAMLGPALIDTIDRREMWTHQILTLQPAAAAGIFTNNLAVSLSACAMGITAGLGTAYAMLLNGLMLGTVGAACWRAGMSLDLWSFVAAHGALELPAIAIAGGAGLSIARGLLFPGRRLRREALAAGTLVAVKLMIGCAPMLVVAGLIEGFYSPTPTSPTLKLAVGAAILALWIIYVRSGARPRGGVAPA